MQQAFIHIFSGAMTTVGLYDSIHGQSCVTLSSNMPVFIFHSLLHSNPSATSHTDVSVKYAFQEKQL